MEANWSSFLSHMSAEDFTHTMGGPRLNPLKAKQIATIDAKLHHILKNVRFVGAAIQCDPEAKKSLEGILNKVAEERSLRVINGFATADCEKMEDTCMKLQEAFESLYPGLVKFQGIRYSSPKPVILSPKKLPAVEIVDENLLKESIAYLSRLDDLNFQNKKPSPENLNCIEQYLIKVSSRIDNYPADPIPDEILENAARLFVNLGNRMIFNALSFFRVCVERNIPLSRFVLLCMSTSSRFDQKTKEQVARQLESVRASPSEFLTALREFRPDFSNESAAETSRKKISEAFETILAFPEKDRNFVNRSLEALTHLLTKSPAEACPEVREFFVKEVPIKFLDTTVLCKLSDILWFCAQSPGLYLLWIRNLEKKTPGVDFKELRITHNEMVALKLDLYNFGMRLNPYMGMALCHYLDLSALERRYAQAIIHDRDYSDAISEISRRGFFPSLNTYPRLAHYVLVDLAQNIEKSVNNLEKVMEYLLIGSRVIREASQNFAAEFLMPFFGRIPDIVLSMRNAIHEQAVEDAQDCECVLSELVFLLETFQRHYNQHPIGVLQSYFRTYESLLVFHQVHPIPDLLERYRHKLSTVISEGFPRDMVQQFLQPHKASYKDPWLVQKLSEKINSILKNTNQHQFFYRDFQWFEIAIDLPLNNECKKEFTFGTHHLFEGYIKRIWIIEEASTFEKQVSKIGSLQATLSSADDDFILITPKLELDLSDFGFNKERLTSIATHLKVDRIILKKKGWFDKEGLTGDQRDEVEKLFAKFPKGTIVWV